MIIELINFKPYPRGALKGFFDLHIDILTISGCSYFEKDGKRWFTFPNKPYEDMRQIDALNGKPEKNRRQSSKSYQEDHRTPEGEDLSQHYSSKDEDIPF